MTGLEAPNFRVLKHELNTFVDDSFNTIAFQPNAKIKTYLEKFYGLMQAFYNSNLLRINPGKTRLMFISKPKYKIMTKCFSFKANGYDIKPVPSLKILGSYLSHDLSNEREISQIIPLLNNRINQLEKLKDHTDFQTRLQFSNSYIIGRLIYMMPLYTNLNCNQRDRLHKVLMRTARMILNSYCFKKSIEYILGKCNWFDINEMIKLSSIKFINNLLITQKPLGLYSNIKINDRVSAPISFYSYPKSSTYKCTLLYKGIAYYNKLPKYLKFLPRKKFQYLVKRERHMLKHLSV